MIVRGKPNIIVVSCEKGEPPVLFPFFSFKISLLLVV